MEPVLFLILADHHSKGLGKVGILDVGEVKHYELVAVSIIKDLDDVEIVVVPLRVLDVNLHWNYFFNRLKRLRTHFIFSCLYTDC